MIYYRILLGFALTLQFGVRVFCFLKMCYNNRVMKSSLITVILTISFLGVAVFGFWLMTNEQMMNHGSCVANSVQGSMCAPTSPFSFAQFHVSAFNNFFSVFVRNFTVSILVIFILLALSAFLNILPSAISRIFKIYSKTERQSGIKYQIKTVSWFSLHENSPALI